METSYLAFRYIWATKTPKISEPYSVLLTGSLVFNLIFWPKDGKDLKYLETLYTVNAETDEGVSLVLLCRGTGT